jgi:hypothetical protein
MHAVAKPAVDRLSWLIQAFTADIPQPAVIGAAQPAVFQSAKGEITGSMSTPALESAKAPSFVAEDDDILAKDANVQNGTFFRQFVDKGERLPIAA